MVAQETVVLHDYSDGGVGTRISKRIRTTSRGTKERVTVDVHAEPLVHVFSDAAAAKEPAEAYAEAIREDMRQQGFASEATRERRTAMARQWRAGPSPSLRKRFSGGRIGETPPKTGNEAPRKWSHSGRLSQGVVAGWSQRHGAFIINKPANRLEEEKLAREFVRDIEALSSPASVFRTAEFRKAVDESIRMLMEKARDERSAKLKALRKQQMAVLIKAAQAVARVAGG